MVKSALDGKKICRIIAILVIVVLLVIRLLFSSTNNNNLFIDVYSYEKTALEILENGYSSLSAYHPPAYPSFIAVCYALFGRNKLAVYVVQALLASISLFLLYRMAEKLAGPFVGMTTVVACALYVPLTLYSGVFLSETLFLFLLISGLYLFVCFMEKPKSCYIGLSALFFGLSALTRSINLLFIIMLPGFLLVSVYLLKRRRKRDNDESESALGSMPLKKTLLSCSIFILVFTSVLAPWTIRNAVLFKEFIPVDTLGGLNLLVGNNEYSQGVYISFSDKQLEELIQRYTGKQQPLKIRYSNGLANLNDKALKEAGINYIVSNPRHFILLTLNRAKRFLVDDFKVFDWVLQTSLKNNTSFGGDAYISLFTILDRIFFCLGLAGLPFLMFNKRTRGLLLFILYYFGTTCCFYITSRYRIPIMPFMAISAALPLSAIVKLIKGKSGTVLNLLSFKRAS